MAYRNFLILITLLILIISQSVSTQAAFSFNFSQYAFSDVGPFLGLTQGFLEDIQVPEKETGQIIVIRHGLSGARLSENLEINMVYRNYSRLRVNQDTARYLSRGFDFGDLNYRYWETAVFGPGLSWSGSFNNLKLNFKSFFLADISIREERLEGDIWGTSASGRYENLKSENHFSSWGYSCDFAVIWEEDNTRIELKIKNILSRLIWPETTYRVGEFRYRDYDYTEDGYRIIPPPFKGTRYNRKYISQLPILSSLAFSWIDNRGLGEFKFFLNKPLSFKIRIPLNSNLALLARVPQEIFGVQYERESLKLNLMMDRLNPFKVKNFSFSAGFQYPF